MTEYKQIFPTCPECLNETLIMTSSIGKNWVKCIDCDYQSEISIQLMGDDDV